MSNARNQHKRVVPSRAFRWVVGGGLAFVTVAVINLAWALFVLPGIALPGPVWQGLLVNLPMLLLLLAWAWVFGRSFIRLRRWLDAHDWLLCPKCEHDLRGLDADPMTCPECGREWTVRQIRASWGLLIIPKKKRSEAS